MNVYDLHDVANLCWQAAPRPSSTPQFRHYKACVKPRRAVVPRSLKAADTPGANPRHEAGPTSDKAARLTLNPNLKPTVTLVYKHERPLPKMVEGRKRAA